jgi:hypothetical protein
VLPYWQSAQKRLQRALGETEYGKMVDALVHAAEVILEA